MHKLKCLKVPWHLTSRSPSSPRSSRWCRIHNIDVTAPLVAFFGSRTHFFFLLILGCSPQNMVSIRKASYDMLLYKCTLFTFCGDDKKNIIVSIEIIMWPRNCNSFDTTLSIYSIIVSLLTKQYSLLIFLNLIFCNTV